MARVAMTTHSQVGPTPYMSPVPLVQHRASTLLLTLTCKSVPRAPLMPPTIWFRMSPGVVLLSLPPLVMAPSRPSEGGWDGRGGRRQWASRQVCAQEVC